MEATPTFYSKWHISIFLHNVFSYNSKKFTQRIASSVMCKTIALFLLNCNINTEITFTGNYWKWRQNDSTVLMGFFKFQAVREICDTFTDRGLPNYPSGAPFTFWEQYINLRFYLSLAILCVLLSTFVVLTLVLVNPWLATVVVSNSLYPRSLQNFFLVFQWFVLHQFFPTIHFWLQIYIFRPQYLRHVRLTIYN